PALPLSTNAVIPSVGAAAVEGPAFGIPITGTVNAPDNTIIPNPPAYEPGVPGQLARWGGEPPSTHGSSAEQLNDRRAPQQGIAPDLAARTSSSVISTGAEGGVERPAFGVPDRSYIHAAT